MPEPSLEQMLKLYTKKDLWERIQQLKQQLADTDKLMLEYLNKCLGLEQQLAEKEKEIAELEEQDEIYQNQTAIAELENVKEKLSNIENTLINCGNGKEDAICWFVNIIDQQIKELKGEK